MQLVRQFDPTATIIAFGQVTAPVAGAIICTTGSLPNGNYIFQYVLSVSDTVAVGKGITVQVRNSIDTVTRAIVGATPAATSLAADKKRFAISANELLRAVAGVAGAAGSVYTAVIGAWPIP